MLMATPVSKRQTTEMNLGSIALAFHCSCPEARRAKRLLCWRFNIYLESETNPEIFIGTVQDGISSA